MGLVLDFLVRGRPVHGCVLPVHHNRADNLDARRAVRGYRDPRGWRPLFLLLTMGLFFGFHVRGRPVHGYVFAYVFSNSELERIFLNF